MLNIIKLNIKSSRPILWIMTGLPFIVSFLAFGGQLTIPVYIAAFYFFTGYNLLIYGTSDIFDRRTTKSETKKHSVSTYGLEQKKRIYLGYGILISNVPILAYLLLVTSGSARWSLITTVFLAVSYGVKGLRLKEIAFVDAITFASFMVMPFICGATFAGATQLSWPIIFCLFFWGIGSYVLSTITRTIDSRDSKTSSIASFLGVRKSARLSLACYLLASAILALAYFPLCVIPALLLSSYAASASFFLKYKSDAQAKHFRRAVVNNLWLNYIISGWIILYLIIIFDPLKLGLQAVAALGWLIIMISGLLLLILLHNIISFRIPKTPRLEEWPRISILIHAHNQADNIASTMLAALGQNYPNYEIIFADLNSDDNTKKIAQSYRDKKLKIVTLPPVPSDWSVNSWASSQLLEQASGQISLLLGADTVMMPNALSSIASIMTTEKKDLISFLPADQNKTFAQKIILSQNQAIFLSAYPAAFLSKNFPQFSSAYGNMMAFYTEKIMALKGFKLVRRSPLEDMELAAQAKIRGLKTAFYLASNLATSQNHADLGLILRQNIRRYYPMVRFNYPLAVFAILAGLFVFTGPLILIIYVLIIGNTGLLPITLGALMAGYAVRFIVAIKSKQNIFSVTLYPLSNVIAVSELAASVVQYELLKPRWQKRTEL